jgi:hypothetical protein
MTSIFLAVIVHCEYCYFLSLFCETKQRKAISWKGVYCSIGMYTYPVNNRCSAPGGTGVHLRTSIRLVVVPFLAGVTGGLIVLRTNLQVLYTNVFFYEYYAACVLLCVLSIT